MPQDIVELLVLLTQATLDESILGIPMGPMGIPWELQFHGNGNGNGNVVMGMEGNANSLFSHS